MMLNSNIVTFHPFRRLKKECVDTIIGRSYVGDWLLFYLLGQNIDSGAYKVNPQQKENLALRKKDQSLSVR